MRETSVITTATINNTETGKLDARKGMMEGNDGGVREEGRGDGEKNGELIQGKKVKEWKERKRGKDGEGREKRMRVSANINLLSVL